MSDNTHAVTRSPAPASADAPDGPASVTLTRGQATWPPLLGVAIGVGLAAALAAGWQAAPPLWWGGAIGAGLALLDAALTGLLLPGRLQGPNVTAAFRLLVFGFFARFLLILVGYAALLGSPQVSASAFALTFLGLHFCMLGGLYLAVNGWLNRRNAAARTAPEDAAPSASS